MSLVRYTLRLRARIIAGDEPDWLKKHSRRAYIVQATLARPTWVTAAMLRPLEQRRKLLSRIHGVEFVMDHDIPLTHPYVCGLTVPANLVLMPRAANANKGNTWAPDQMRLFTDVQQFSLEFQ